MDTIKFLGVDFSVVWDIIEKKKKYPLNYEYSSQEVSKYRGVLFF